MDEVPDLGRRNFLRGRLSVSPPPPPVAVIDLSCLALRGVACMSCRDACPTGAVRFVLRIGGAHPQVAVDACTGCGECVSICPAAAIRVGPQEAEA